MAANLFIRAQAGAWRPRADAACVLSTLGVRRWSVTTEPALDSVADIDGVLVEWLDARGADAVLVRPDAYVYGCAIAAELDTLFVQFGSALYLTATHVAPQEIALCRA